ncbi:MAG TPA: hypothetical protein PKI60_07845 [Oscillospiraceae bacterium]|nr:hypothetical protein [Oscillospiraceae bacterium]
MREIKYEELDQYIGLPVFDGESYENCKILEAYTVKEKKIGILFRENNFSNYNQYYIGRDKEKLNIFTSKEIEEIKTNRSIFREKNQQIINRNF